MSQRTVERPRAGDDEPERSTDEAAPAAPSGDEAEETEGSKPPRDAIFEILRASRRREVLLYLDDHGGEAKIGALAEHIAAEENDVDRSEVTASQRKRAYVGLYQMHLPKMDGHGVVEWDKDRGFVELLEPARWLLEYLYFDPERSRAAREGATDPIAAIRRRLGRIVSA